jgi:pimeloyl-ACP methyl ester carboxylesterase
MGRSPLSGWRLLVRLRACGITPRVLGYATPFQSFDSIRNRLVVRITALAAQGDYVLIGHSLGGVLLRAAVAALPAGVRLPRQLFLLGSPVRPSRLARKLHRNGLFRLLAGDCGQLLASAERMARIEAGTLSGSVPVIGLVGVRGWRGRWSPFGDEVNDGIVALSEVSAPWLAEVIQVPVFHTYMPSSERVAALVLERVSGR